MNTQIHQEAADWFVEFRTGEPDSALRKAFDAWIRKSPEHLRAYLEVAEIWQDTPYVSAHARESAEALIEAARMADNVVSLQEERIVPAKLEAGRPVPRRRWVAVAASVLLLLTGALTWTLGQRDVYATDTGEQRTITLTDGSMVELNSHTKVRVAYHLHERAVELIEGQALFRVAKSPTRPFVVRSGSGQVRAVGTEFDVYRKLTETVVSVVEGRVAVIPDLSPSQADSGGRQDAARIMATSSTPEVLLAAGQQLTVSPRVASTPTPIDAASITSWTQHKVVFKSSPLPEVFEELNRYCKQPLRIQGPGLDDFRISGTYTTTDPTLLIRFLREQPGLIVQETDTAIIVSKVP